MELVHGGRRRIPVRHLLYRRPLLRRPLCCHGAWRGRMRLRLLRWGLRARGETAASGRADRRERLRPGVGTHSQACLRRRTHNAGLFHLSLSLHCSKLLPPTNLGTLDPNDLFPTTHSVGCQ